MRQVIAQATIQVDPESLHAHNIYLHSKHGNDASLQQALEIALDTIKTSFKPGRYFLQVLDNKNIQIRDTLGNCLFKSAEGKIQKVFNMYLGIKNIENQEKTPPSKNIFIKAIDYIFRQKLYHAKACDIASILLFGCIMLSIILHSPTALNITHTISNMSQPIFGGLNILVGSALLYQSYLNYKKAKKNQNKGNMKLAIATAFFSIVIMGLGGISVLSFEHITSDVLFKLALGSCSMLAMGFGVFNFSKAQVLKNKLKNQSFNKVLKEELEITKKEKENLKKNIHKYTTDELKNHLKKLLSEDQFKAIEENDKENKRKLLYVLELEMLQNRKTDHIQSIIGEKLIKEAKEFLINNKNEKDLKNKIFSEITKRQIAESFRILGPILGIGGFILSRTSQISNKEFTYNLLMLLSTISVFWLNYIKSWRYVPVEENKKCSAT